MSVDFDISGIRTGITGAAARLARTWVTEFSHPGTREQRFEHVHREFSHDPAESDREVVARERIPAIVRTLSDSTPTIFPE